jgi:hypothetical protein
MNFFFMLTLIFIILIFIKINMDKLPNYGFMAFVIGLLAIFELYNFKENFKPYRYEGIYDRYYENNDVLHLPELASDRSGLKCELEKNVLKKNIQDKKFSEYQELKNNMNNVLFGDKQFDEIKFPENYGDISEEEEKIEKVNNIVCPPLCHTLDDTNCEDALDIRVPLNNEDELTSTNPVFTDRFMMEEAQKCLRITAQDGTDPTEDADCGDNCTFNDTINKCVYGVKKCSFDDTREDGDKCRKKCRYFDRKNTCPNDGCTWNSETLSCGEQS